jgi:SSS family transporter
MSSLDWMILAFYLVGMILLSIYLSKGQSTLEDYYLGGRNLPWWALGISTMATQSSANSFVGIPAFVALAPGGGLSWLQYELALPIAMGLTMIFLIPVFRGLRLVSVYEYLELRFDHRTRKTVSLVFLVSRGLAAGIGIYASAVVLSVCLEIPVGYCILIIGIVTVIYDTIGGMAAVVWADVVQMCILIGGLLLCIYLAIDKIGGTHEILNAFPPERLKAFVHGTGVGDGTTQAPSFWGFLIGGLFLYISYYGVDQSQAQRALSSPSIADTKRSLVLNALARFPLTVLYILMGLAVGAAFLKSDALRAALPEGKLDGMVPVFIVQELPAGFRGLIIAAILAAAMSALEACLNSISAATVRDFIEPWIAKKGLSKEEEIRRLFLGGKWTTAAWGVILIGCAFLTAGISNTVVEGINMIGSLFYGPILAAFAVGILDRRSRGPGVMLGMVAGVAVNLGLWLGAGDLFWMWWNVTGLVVAGAVASISSRFMAPPSPAQLVGTTLDLKAILTEERRWVGVYVGLLFYFVAMLLLVVYSREVLEAIL